MGRRETSGREGGLSSVDGVSAIYPRLGTPLQQFDIPAILPFSNLKPVSVVYTSPFATSPFSFPPSRRGKAACSVLLTDSFQHFLECWEWVSGSPVVGMVRRRLVVAVGFGVRKGRGGRRMTITVWMACAFRTYIEP